MAGKVPNQKLLLLTNFMANRKVGAYKSATDTYTRPIEDEFALIIELKRGLIGY